MAKQPQTQDVVKEYKNFRAMVANLMPYIIKIEQDFSSQAYKDRAISNKGIFTKLIDSVEVLHGGKGLIADDFDDVVHALQTIMIDIKGISDGLRGADSLEAQAAKRLQEAESKMNEQETPVPTNNTAPEETKAPWDDIKIPTNLSGILGG
jgi:hypothetical protein